MADRAPLRGPADLRRHLLLHVDPTAWSEALAADAALAAVPILAGWAERGWPVIVRRFRPGEAGRVPVAVPLPRETVPNRIALALPWSAVRDAGPPPPLRAIAPPEPWRGAVTQLCAAGEATGIEPRVFGSLLWQHITGLPYLSAVSDLDLIWPVGGDPVGLAALCRRIAGIEAVTGLRIDGELIDAAGAAVQWREYGSGADEVMVKTMTGVEVRPRRACFGVLAAAA